MTADWFLFALSAAVLTGFAVVLQKRTLKREHAVQNILVIVLGQALLSVFLLPLADFSGFRADTVFLTALSTLSASGAAIYSAKAFRNLEVSLAAPLFALGTVFLVVLSVVFLNERLLAGEILGIAVILTGAYLVDFRHRNLLEPLYALKNRYIRDDLYSVIGYSLAYLFAKPVLDKVDPLTLLIIQNLIIAAFLLVYSGAKFPLTKDIAGAIKSDGLFHVLIGLFTFGQALLTFYAVKLADVSLVIPVYRTWILIAVLLGGRLFHEHNLKYRVLGAVLMVLGVFAVLNPGLIDSGSALR